MTISGLCLNRLRVLRRGHVAYDQSFHRGVNIIRGENGSGKSTVADFIFYVLGGEFDQWKGAAGECDLVQAEIETIGGVITVSREIDGSLTKPSVYFGNMLEAGSRGLDGWKIYPIRRRENQESFSQILFRSAGIPEAQSEPASNVTMHQIMRLMYSDQRTPAGFLFRFESFDTREIREAAGDLLCGLSVYEAYEAELKLRQLKKNFDELRSEFSLLMAGMPNEDGLIDPAAVRQRFESLTLESSVVKGEIEEVDDLVSATSVKDFLSERRRAASKLEKMRREMDSLEKKIEVHDFELAELDDFVSYLEQLLETVQLTDEASKLIGEIDFTHCPACLMPLADSVEEHRCLVCGSEADPEGERSKYLAIRLDIEIQNREARQLVLDKKEEQKRAKRELQKRRREYEPAVSDFVLNYDVSNSPRESFLATRQRRLGQIEQEKLFLSRLVERCDEIDRVSVEKAKVQRDLDETESKLKELERRGKRRRSVALTHVSEIAKSILSLDLERQAEFADPQQVSISFGDNAMKVDGDMNFSESSNVILKNTALLSIFSAATQDREFHHPRFLLIDNVEDKGMEQIRSHNFQRIIVDQSKLAEVPHQIIFTTSMMNPELDTAEFTIGPYYTHDNKTLNLGY